MESFFFSSFLNTACTSIMYYAPIFNTHQIHNVQCQYLVHTPRTNIQCAQLLYYTPICDAHNLYTTHQYLVRTTFILHTNIQYVTMHQYSVHIAFYTAHQYSMHTTFILCTNFYIAHKYPMRTTFNIMRQYPVHTTSYIVHQNPVRTSFYIAPQYLVHTTFTPCTNIQSAQHSYCMPILQVHHQLCTTQH